MDEGSRLDLSKYRFERANNSVKVAKRDFECGDFNESVSRSYYAVFYALLAVTELDGFESSKHSGVISHFSLVYLKTNIFDRKLSELINTAFKLRHRADYEGLYEVNADNAKARINAAEEVIRIIEPYLILRWKELEDNQ